MRTPYRPTLSPSALALAIAACFTAGPDVQAQQILRGGGNGAGLNGTVSGLGGVGGGGGGGGSLRNKGGDAAQTFGESASGGSGEGAGRGGQNGVAGGGGGGGDKNSTLGGLGGIGGTGNITTSESYSLWMELAGEPGSDGHPGDVDIAGGGGGGAGLVALAQNARIETSGQNLSGGRGGGSDIYAFFFQGNGGGGGAGLVLAQGGLVRVTGNSVVAGGDGGSPRSVHTGGSGGDGGAGIFLYAGGTLAVTSGSVQGGNGGIGTGAAGAPGAGVLSNQGQILNSGTIAGGSSGPTSGRASNGGNGIQAWGGSIINDTPGTISGGFGDGGASSAPGAGGSAILFRNGLSATLFNYGRIQGGTGNYGAGGVGVSGAGTGNISIVNIGTITGGVSAINGIRANAIELFGSNNLLELQPASTVIGNVVVAPGGTGNTLALGGDGAAGAFDVSQIGPGQTYQGFDRYEKRGSGTWTLSGTGNQDWRVKQGTLIGNDLSLSGNVSFASASHATLIFDQSVTGTYGGTISGDGSLTKTGRGYLTLTGNSAYTGGTSVLAGTLALSALGPAGAVTGAIDTQARLEIYTTNPGIGRITIASGNGSAHFYSGASAGDAQLINGNLLGFYDISSAGRARLSNNGNLFFFANSSAGEATISNAAQTTFLGNADGDNATIVNGPGAVVDFSYSNGPAGDNKLSVGGLAGEGTFLLGGNALTINGGSGGAVISGVIADGGNAGGVGASLVKAGNGTLTLRGRNTYTGATTVRGGVLVAGSADALRNSNALAVESAGTFSIGGNDVTVGALSGAGLVTNTGSTGNTLTVDSAQHSTFNGRLTDSQTAILSLTKRGTGTLILNGSNTYAGSIGGERGQTSIYGGTLQFGDGATRSLNNLGGDVFVYEAGTLSIQGAATVNVANNVNLIGNNGTGAQLALAATTHGPSLTADRVIIGADTTFNLSGIQGAFEQDRVLIDTRSGIQGDFATVNIGGFGGAVDYLSVTTRKSTDSKQYYATYGLNWAANNSLAHGTFTLADSGNRFTVASSLSDQAANAATGWNGKSLVKAGNGTLILAGANTYTGGTTIAGGTLQLGDGGSNGSIIGNVINHGTLAVNRNDTTTIAGDISGTGALRQLGSGTTILTGTNQYLGGTTVDGGTLRAGSAGAFVAGTAYTINGGTLDLGNHDLTIAALSGSGGTVALGTAKLTVDQSSDTAYAGALTGSGELVKLGTGTLMLTGPSTLNLRLAGGALVTQAAGLGSNASLAAGTALTINQIANATFGGRLSGQGDVRKLGAGKLELTGDSSAFAGTTTVQAGTLAVNGKLGGTLDVAAAGRLQGNGSVGNTTVNGSVAPGNSIGTLRVTGDLVLNPGSTYEVELDPAGSADRIVATGTATLNGGAVQVVAGSGNYARAARYTILTANGGRTGTFGSVTSNLGFLAPALEYDANNAYLTMTRNGVSFQEAGTTHNQTAAGAAAESLRQGNPLYDATLGLSVSQAQAAFDQLSGEAYASVRTALIEDSRYLRDAINERLRAAFDPRGQAGAGGDTSAGASPRQAIGNTERGALWAQTFGAWAQTRGDGNAARLSRTNGGLLAGADAPVSQHWRLGALTGYSRTRFNVKDRQSSGASDNYHLGLYAGADWNGLTLRAGASYTWHDLSARRDVDFPGFTDRLKSGYRANTSQIYGELGYRSNIGSVAFEPFANVARVKLRTNGFSEQGGAAALTSQRAGTDATFTTAGLRATASFDTQGTPLTLRLMTGWRHAFGDMTPGATMRFASGSDTYTVSGVSLARNTAVLEAGLDYAATSNAALGLAYNGQLGSGLSDHAIKATFNLRF